MSSTKELVFSVTLADCEVQTFRSGGKGGQNQNKVESGVRIIHHPSGARGEARDSRDQPQNKRQAFVRMVETPAFKSWVHAVTRGLKTPLEIEAEVEREVNDPNVTITEVWGGKSRGWVRADNL